MTRGTATVIATLPPPHTGRTRITELVVNRLRERGEVTVINLASGNVARRRSWRAILALRQLWASVRLVARRAGSGNVYISINGGTAAVLDLPLAIAARASGRRLVVHHHSFRYIETPTALMRAFYRLAGDQVVDVALCPRMARGLEHHYQRTGVRVVPNLVETQPPPHPTIPTGPVKLGHLANLTLEKGVGRAIAAFEHARASGIDVELHLAGPCANPETRQAVEAAVNAWPAAVTYHGPVYDDAKDEFYASLDLFLYPTGYVVEAQPLVLLEALGAGVSVISVERGCIGGMADGSHGSVAICALEDFSSTVSDTAARIASGGPARRAANRDAAVSAASRIRCEASTALSALVDEILAIAPTHQGAA